MAKQNKVVVFDLDGTFLNGNNEVIGGQKTIDEIRQLKEAGCRMAICTGRLDHDIVKIDEKFHLNIHERISLNGAVFYIGSHLEASLLDKKAALEVNELVKNFTDVRVEMNTVTNRYWHSDRDPDFPKELYDSSVITDADYASIIPYQPVVLFLIVGKTERLKEIRTIISEKVKHVNPMLTSPTSLEIVPEGINKGTAVAAMYPDETVYAVGDSDSDKSMMPMSEKFYYLGKDDCDGAVRKNDISEALEDILKEVRS